jgi:hypothetical protein
MAAKKDGFKGEVAYGVVTGSGKNLFFQLPGNGEVAAAMKIDSWADKPPTKKSKLREFLADNDLNFKPSYHLIMDVATAPDPEAESDVPVAPPPPGSEALDDDEPSGSESLESETLEQESEEVPEAPPTPDRPLTAGDAAASFKARLEALLPRIKQAAGTPAGEQAKLRASEAGAMARQKNFEQANAVLQQVEQILRGAATPSGGTADLLAVWRDAKDSVDDQLNRLAGAMRTSGHPYLMEIAEFGLSAAAEDPTNVFVTMQAALFDLNAAQGPGRSAAAKKVLQAVAGYRKFLSGNEMLEILDDNGLTGPLTVRKTLADALDRLEQAAQPMAG